MIVKWNVDTGYVNRMPDRETEVADEDLEGLSEEEQENLISDAIDQDFRNQITWYRTDK